MTSKIAPPLTPKTLLLVTEWHWSGCTSSQDAFFEEGKHLVGCVDSDTFAQHQMYNFKYAGCSDAESQPGTLVRLSLLLRVLLLPVLLFSQNSESAYLKIFMGAWEDRSYALSFEIGSSYITEFSHIFFWGQNDSISLYNHQCTHPQGFSTAGLPIAFPFWKMGWGSILTLDQPMRQPDFIWSLYHPVRGKSLCSVTDGLGPWLWFKWQSEFRWSTLRFGVNLCAFWISVSSPTASYPLHKDVANANFKGAKHFWRKAYSKDKALSNPKGSTLYYHINYQEDFYQC